MRFEMDPFSREYRATLNGENPAEVSRIAAALGYVSTGDKVPPVVNIQGERTIQGRLARECELGDARFMVEAALNILPDTERTASNNSLEFTFIQGR